MPTYHLIPHTHWDREWYLAFDEFRVLLVHLLDDLLETLEARPDYESFTLDGQTVVVDDYLEVRPDRRALVERLVREGRLFVGPWYILPDEFLVSGESTVRNLLRGRAAARALGGSVEMGYLPDTFGHIAQMPQILRGFGLDTAVAWRGFGGEPGQEASEYRWRSPDGSEVLMEHLSDVGYSGAYFNSTDPRAAEERFADFRRRVDPRALTDERLMLSGGDHHFPFRDLPEVIAHLNDAGGDGARVRHSSLTAFARALRAGTEGLDLPVADGELRFGYRWAFNVTGGVYSSRMYLKQANAAGQWLLERRLEPMNVLALARGARSQTPLIRQGWTYLLQNHPHDSICGCSIDPVHREMQTRFEKLQSLGRGVERFAWMALAPDEEGASGDDRRLTFFNPSPFPRDEVVECDVRFFRQQVVVGLNPDVVTDPPLPPVEGFVLEDADGRTVPFDVVERVEDFGIAYTRYDYPSQTMVERFRVRVPLERLPPLGLRALRVRRTDRFPEPERSPALRAEGRAVENPYLRVEAEVDGSFFVTDRETGERYGPLNVFEDGGDAGDEYNFSPPARDRVLRSPESARIEAVERLEGGWEAVLRVRGVWTLPAGLGADDDSRAGDTAELSFETTARLTPFSRFVRFDTVVDNPVRDHRLRVLFDTGCRTNVHRADGQFAVIRREQRAYDPADFSIEVPAAVSPMQRFMAVEEGGRAAAVLAVGLPEYELKHDSGGTVALTLLRCVGELARGALRMRPGGRAGWRNRTPDAQCPGRHRFAYGFAPGASAARPEGLARLNEAAEALHLPVRFAPGKRDETPVDAPFLHLAPSTLVLSALKEAEDGNGFVVRIYNPSGEPVSGAVTFAAPPAGASRVDLEEREAPGAVRLDGAALRDEWPPYRIHSYRIRESGAGKRESVSASPTPDS